MAAAAHDDLVVTLVNRAHPVAEAQWRAFWERLRRRALVDGEAAALVSSLSTHPPDEGTVHALVRTLREGHAAPSPIDGAVNIVGTGGGPRTFNLSTAAAFVAASMGVRVLKSGSRAYTSALGSVDLLERLGVRLAGSYDEAERMLERYGIACTGAFVYPCELRLLARSLLPLDIRALGRFFNVYGPVLAVVPASAQVTGVADPAVLPVYRHLAARGVLGRLVLCADDCGVDELVSIADNSLYDGAAGREVVVSPRSLGLCSDGSLEDLRPCADADAVEHWLRLLDGAGPPAATDSIALNAAALGITAGTAADWPDAVEAARDAMRRADPRRLVERIAGDRQ